MFAVLFAVPIRCFENPAFTELKNDPQVIPYGNGAVRLQFIAEAGGGGCNTETASEVGFFKTKNDGRTSQDGFNAK